MANSARIKNNYESFYVEDLCSQVGLVKKTAPVTKPPLFQTTDDAPVMTSHPYLSGAQACLGKTL